MVIKMKYKLIILTILIFATCGCNVKYNLNIDENNNFFESVDIISDGNETLEKEYLYSLYLSEYPIYYSEEFRYFEPSEKIDGNTYYIKNIKENEYGYEANYKSNFNGINNYNDSRMVLTSFGDTNIGYNENSKRYYIKLSNLKILKEEKSLVNIIVNIKISDKFNVVNHNSQKNSEGVYTWNLNNTNNSLIFEYCDKNICNKSIDTVVNDNSVKDDNSLSVVVLGILIFIFILTIIITMKRMLSNEK